MPSRFFIAFILLFWIGSMAWLTVREVLPRYSVGEPPPFSIEMTDEVNTGSGAANWIDWKVLYQGKPVGSCNSAVRRLPDRTYELKTHYKFTDFNLLAGERRRLQIDYVVTLEGKLGCVSILVKVSSILGQVTPDLEGMLIGEVEDGILKSYGVGRKGEMELLKSELPAVKISQAESILNTMHLQNRIRGLYV